MWRAALRLSRHGCQLPICQQHVRLPPIPPRQLPPTQCVYRGYSSQGPAQGRVVFFGIPNPYIWLRNKLSFYYIQASLDRDFSIEEFTVGAKQAFSYVSTMLSQCKFDALENLVANETLKDVQDKCSELSAAYRKALAVESEEVMYALPGDVSISYEDNGRKFVSILMRFWYLKQTDLPNEETEGTKVFRVVVGEEGKNEAPQILTANYVFCREFTQGVEPDWIITRIEHVKLLE
ncbi:m-AAA protease-interacting protein 1, mitochondrial [Hyperolius riggenbachi]|uniref:m-AAA protease-interacting protein 1, mitochondrial n=1 Tax=Hyperolius riggenbachi TaxID=752182 RepID=UPI0035A27CFD